MPEIKIDHSKEETQNKINDLKKKIVELEKRSDFIRPFVYEIKNVKQDYKWKNVIVRNDGKIIFIGNSKKECEVVLIAIEESYKNGFAVASDRK